MAETHNEFNADNDGFDNAQALSRSKIRDGTQRLWDEEGSQDAAAAEWEAAYNETAENSGGSGKHGGDEIEPLVEDRGAVQADQADITGDDVVMLSSSSKVPVAPNLDVPSPSQPILSPTKTTDMGGPLATKKTPAPRDAPKAKNTDATTKTRTLRSRVPASTAGPSTSGEYKLFRMLLFLIFAPI